jgi:hypothetical protein
MVVRFLAGVLALLAIFPGTPRAAMHCACAMEVPTVREDSDLASVVFYATVMDSGEEPPAGLPANRIVISVRQVLKNHPILKKQTYFVLDRGELIGQKPVKYIIFGDVFRGQFDLARGIEIQSVKSVAYFKGAIALGPNKTPQALRYFFRFLEDPDPEVAKDAFREFSRASYPTIRAAAAKLPAETLLKWLRNPKTLAYRRSLYALLLGHSGAAKPFSERLKILKAFQKGKPFRSKGELIGYTLLQPTLGWKYVRNVLGNSELDFWTRFNALQALQFFRKWRHDVVTRNDLIDGWCSMLEQTDIADFAIEDMREAKVWDVADQVLALAKRNSHQVPLIKRIILRYALCCPKKYAKAAAYVKAERKRDKEYVEDVEEILKLEKESQAGAVK